MATLTVYPDPDPETTSVDGFASRTGVDQTWANIIAGAGNSSDASGSAANVVNIQASATANQWATNSRGILLFDTSALTANANISNAVLSLYGNAKLDLLGITPNIDIYTSTPASNTAIVDADYGQTGNVSQTGGNPISYAGWTLSAYNDFTFDATGISNISKTGVSKFAAKNANYDVAASAPTYTASLISRINAIMADTAGTSTDPKLVITYTTTRIRDVIMHGGVVVRKR